MHSIAINKSSNRPSLSIDTNLKKKRWSKSIFSSKETTNSPEEPTHPLSDSITNNSNCSLSNLSDKIKSAHSNRTHSVQSVLKKLHRPHFHIRSGPNKPTPEEDYTFNPVAPEPVHPPLVNWSPEAPLSPPPWELKSNKQSSQKSDKISLKTYSTFLTMSSDAFEEYDSISTLDSHTSNDYHSDSELGNLSSMTEKITLDDTEMFSPTDSIDHESDVTLVGSTLSAGEPQIRRRSSCPSYDLASPTSTLAENDIIAITEQHTRYMSVLKKYKHPADKKPALKSCQKAKARAAEAAANGTSITQTNSFYASFCEDMKYLYIPNVFDPATRELIVEFSVIKPRKYKLHRKTSWKREAKALMSWHHNLEESIQKPEEKIEINPSMPLDKQVKYELTRKFIMREFFDTEVNFWNQLYYSKVIFYDAVISGLSKGNQLIKEADVDIFANLFDLMQFSAKLINRLRHFQMEHTKDSPVLQLDPIPNVDSGKLYLGKAMREMSKDMVVFLRCALDYKENRKTIDNNVNNKAYLIYNQKLSLRKETSQFTIRDYLIIPIQRVARYGLLIAGKKKMLHELIHFRWY
ncbi:hypothetical protein INT48_005488 [Thamnidium elegans]|uniref:DH domain-containing protein n=1 Tax=Thamnidium elegans TaxID=101142 RepID=A0A8H7VXZ5_9FUNG|nr:hypothetical protein INT48_005488 [Thamnidium elegans]